MTKENRFEGLMGVVGKNKNAKTSKRSDVQKPKNRKKSASKSDVQSSNSSSVSTSEHLNIQTSKIQKDSSKLNTSTSKKAKSVDSNYTRTTLYLPKKMHKKLKVIALEQETEMSSIVEELIEGWLNSQS